MSSRWEPSIISAYTDPPSLLNWTWGRDIRVQSSDSNISMKPQSFHTAEWPFTSDKAPTWQSEEPLWVVTGTGSVYGKLLFGPLPSHMSVWPPLDQYPSCLAPQELFPHTASTPRVCNSKVIYIHHLRSHLILQGWCKKYHQMLSLPHILPPPPTHRQPLLILSIVIYFRISYTAIY